MKVFFNYVMTAFETGYYKVTESNFVPMTQIFVLFVKSGFLSHEQQNKFFYAYVLSLKKAMFPAGGKEEPVSNKDIIKITWSLINMEESGNLTIPLIPKLLE